MRNKEKMIVFLTVLCLSVVTKASPVAYYPLDGDPNDAAGSYDGVAYSADGIIDWETEGAGPSTSGSLHFAGGTNPDFVNCSDVPVSRAATTIAYWAKADVIAYMEPINKYATDASGVGFRVGFRNNGMVRLWTGSKDNNSQDVADADTGVCYSTSEWTHHAWVFDNSEIRFYVNGLLRCTKTASKEISAPGVPLRLGRIDYTNSYGYQGNLDDVKIWNRALTKEEVAQEYVNVAGGSFCLNPPEYDFTGPDGEPDCIINLYDFAAFAAEWLEDNLVTYQ